MAVPAWDVLIAPRREPRWVRLRRGLVVTAAAVLVLTGAVTITGQVLTWLAPPSAPTPPVAVTDRDFDGVAVPFAVDYLSWDQDDRESRQVALARSAASDTTVDGWTGAGRQWADSPTAIGIARSGRDRAVVTVRVRVTPFTATSDISSDIPSDTPSEPAPDSSPGERSEPAPESSGSAPDETPGGVPNVASGPVPGEGGWKAGAPRWLNVAVPVARRGERVVVTAPPALVGSPQPRADRAAVPLASGTEDAAAEDGAFARDTREVITTLVRAYGTGELTYARAPNTSFTGLGDAATVEAVTAWRVREPDGGTDEGSDQGADGADGLVRAGDVTVTWALSGGAGTVTCTYRVELRGDGGRWYLASIGAATEAVR